MRTTLRDHEIWMPRRSETLVGVVIDILRGPSAWGALVVQPPAPLRARTILVPPGHIGPRAPRVGEHIAITFRPATERRPSDPMYEVEIVAEAA